MADSTIDQLTSLTDAGVDISTAEGLNFVASYNSTAYRVTGQKFVEDVATSDSFKDVIAEKLNYHGGVKEIKRTKQDKTAKSDTYTVTYADNSTSEFTVPYGRGIKGIKVFFALSASNEDGQTLNWDTKPQKLSYQKRYLWSYIQIAFDDIDEPFKTDPYICGVYGNTGRGITSIEPYGEKVGNKQEYQITVNDPEGDGDAATYKYSVYDGRSIVSITEDESNMHQAGAVDTYYINFDVGNPFKFSVQNGTNGEGAVGTVAGIAPETGSENVNLIIQENGEPSTSGVKNQLYFDTSKQQLYVCDSTNKWRKASVTVDDEISSTSTNPVQNTVITSELAKKQLLTNSLEVKTDVANDDCFPYYDSSEQVNYSTKWSNIVSKIRAAFFGTEKGILRADGSGKVSQTKVLESDIEDLAVTQGKIAVGATYTAISFEIARTKWDNGNATITVDGVTEDNAVIVTPAPESLAYYSAAKIRATVQGNGSLTFQCESVPAVAIVINALIPR